MNFDSMFSRFDIIRECHGRTEYGRKSYYAQATFMKALKMLPQWQGMALKFLFVQRLSNTAKFV